MEHAADSALKAWSEASADDDDVGYTSDASALVVCIGKTGDGKARAIGADVAAWAWMGEWGVDVSQLPHVVGSRLDSAIGRFVVLEALVTVLCKLPMNDLGSRCSTNAEICSIRLLACNIRSPRCLALLA